MSIFFRWVETTNQCYWEEGTTHNISSIQTSAHEFSSLPKFRKNKALGCPGKEVNGSMVRISGLYTPKEYLPLKNICSSNWILSSTNDYLDVPLEVRINGDRISGLYTPKEYLPFTHRIHVWCIYLHLPQKSTLHVGKYNIHGSYGFIRMGEITH